MLIRKPAVANFFYPGNQTELKKMVSSFLEDGQDIEIEGKLTGIIAPHAGYIYSGIVAGASYKQLQKLDKNKKWRFILLGPTHRYPLKTASVCAFDYYETPLGRIKVADIAKEMVEKIGFIEQADYQEHCLEVQLPFLQMIFGDNFEIIPLILGGINVMFLADYLKTFMDDNTILIVSTDLSHYYPYDTAVEFDNVCNKAIPSLDIDEMIKHGDACGKVGIVTSMLMAKDLGWKSTFLDYKNSGDTAGTKDKVVGYGAYAYSKLT